MVIAEGPSGYAALARTISEAQLRGEKGAPHLAFADLATSATRGPCFFLTGCRKGAVPAALVRDGPAAAERALSRLVDAFGRDRVLVELWDHGDPMDRPRNDALARLAARAGVEVVVTNNVHYATPDRHRLATARGDPQPAQPRRARRVVAGHSVRASAQSGRAAPALRSLSGCGRARG